MQLNLFPSLFRLDSPQWGKSRIYRVKKKRVRHSDHFSSRLPFVFFKFLLDCSRSACILDKLFSLQLPTNNYCLLPALWPKQRYESDYVKLSMQIWILPSPAASAQGSDKLLCGDSCWHISLEKKIGKTKCFSLWILHFPYLYLPYYQE